MSRSTPPRSRIRALHDRLLGKGRRRPRHVRSTDEILLDMLAKTLAVLDIAEREMRVAARDYPPQVLAEYLAGAAETRRELESQRRDILDGMAG
ncbi:hypothetical protein CA606_20040 [Caulobacter vibrioides]|uniref:Uncharacterized protein n=1 Tax=Caulobacter vibrioides TaxID=155892 RepID=A0A291IDB8_CAUVI|nr:hypothetical protein [Caulobacter vibrioides]ATG88188.1 hypothetical protein CA606_20040 [Caulobacter vibrioides]